MFFMEIVVQIHTSGFMYSNGNGYHIAEAKNRFCCCFCLFIYFISFCICSADLFSWKCNLNVIIGIENGPAGVITKKVEKVM